MFGSASRGLKVTVAALSAVVGLAIGAVPSHAALPGGAVAAGVQPAASTATTTLLASAPASPVGTGASVTFTATVTASSGPVTGSVQFLDGSVAIGSPVVVDNNGNAAVTTTFAVSGNHSITASFTGTGDDGPSVSPALLLVVQQIGVVLGPMAYLSIAPTTADSATPVTLTALVVPVAAGVVQFFDGSTPIGAAQTLSGPNASLTQTFAAGDHTLTAVFTPTDLVDFSVSTSAPKTLTVTSAATGGPLENIVTTVSPGSLTISVADTSPAVLPPPVLNATATYLSTVGSLHQVTVTDTRAGSPGWTASGQVGDFLLTGNSSKFIAGTNLGWTPQVTSHGTGQIVTAGVTIPPAAPPVLSNPASDTVPPTGLYLARTLATAAAGASTGTTLLDAGLVLNVPTTAVAGVYEATLTLTAI